MSLLSIIALILIFLGGIGAILLTISQSIEGARDKQEMIDLTKTENLALKGQLSDLKKERDSLKYDLERRDLRIQAQTATIIELNEKLVEKSNYISDHLTGGQGYPFIIINPIKSRNPSDDELTTFTIVNDTDLPLYDVVAIVHDWNYILSKMKKNESREFPLLRQEDLANSILYRFYENQLARRSDVISRNKFDLRDGLLYIKLKCRSSFVFEKIAFVLENRFVHYGFIVYDDEGRVLKEWVSPGTSESAKIAIKKKYDLIPQSVKFTLTD